MPAAFCKAPASRPNLPTAVIFLEVTMPDEEKKPGESIAQHRFVDQVRP
jgi:hypothetical protein